MIRQEQFDPWKSWIGSLRIRFIHEAQFRPALRAGRKTSQDDNPVTGNFHLLAAKHYGKFCFSYVYANDNASYQAGMPITIVHVITQQLQIRLTK